MTLFIVSYRHHNRENKTVREILLRQNREIQHEQNFTNKVSSHHLILQPSCDLS